MNLVLIGMPGAGKSTTGVVLAKALGYDFLDTDLLLQKQVDMTLQHYIDQKGMAAFIEAEAKVIQSLDMNKTVIATGGSVIYSPEAMAHLRSMGLIIYLKVSYEDLEKRLANFSSRGIAIRKGASLKDVYQERASLYDTYGDVVVDETGLTFEEVVHNIVAESKAYHES